MTFEEVAELVSLQVGDASMLTNGHGISLTQALVRPQRISVIAQTVEAGRVKEEVLIVWLVGQEGGIDGYQIIMRDDGLQFGLATSGFPADRYPSFLVGWYGNLMSAFMGM
jgi:hypothetical protein